MIESTDSSKFVQSLCRMALKELVSTKIVQQAIGPERATGDNRRKKDEEPTQLSFLKPMSAANPHSD